MSLMSLASHRALKYTSDMFGGLTYYYEFTNGNHAHIMKRYNEYKGRLLYDAFYTREGESHKMLGIKKDDVLLLLDHLDKDGEACGIVRI